MFCMVPWCPASRRQHRGATHAKTKTERRTLICVVDQAFVDGVRGKCVYRRGGVHTRVLKPFLYCRLSSIKKSAQLARVFIVTLYPIHNFRTIQPIIDPIFKSAMSQVVVKPSGTSVSNTKKIARTHARNGCKKRVSEIKVPQAPSCIE